METISTAFAYLQIPLVMLLAAHCIKVRHNVTGWISKWLLALVGCCAYFLGWRFATIDTVTDPATLKAGGISVQTLALVALYVSVHALGSMSTHKK